MKRAWKSIAVAAVAAVALSLLSAPPAFAAEQTLGVNYAQRTGSFRGGASGTLYGLGDAGAPTAALLNGAHVTNTSQKAPYGTQHPSGDALKVEDGFFAKNGDDLYIYVQDYYPDWAYNGGVRPGDTRTYDLATGTFTNAANGVWDYLEVVKIVTEAVASQSDRPNGYVFIPFNEADGGNWYGNWGTMKNTFLADWQSVYTAIQTIWSQHGLGHARIGGPGDSAWQATRTADFLDFTKANNSLPDIIIWHELGIDNLATFRSHLAAYRAQESSRAISARPINITEYGLLRDMSVPGQLIQWFALFESSKVDAQTAYWNYAGNLSDNSARPNGANAGWWMFKWYGDLEGSQTAAVTPPQLNVADTLQGIAAIDDTARRATVLFGGTNDDVRVNVTGLPASFGGTVDVEVREAPLSGAEGLAPTPRVIQAIEGATVTNGALSVLVDTYDRYAGYQLVITPRQVRDVAASRNAQPWSASVEAENTALTQAAVYTQSPTANGGWIFLASGGRDVGSFNQVGSKADWTVSVPSAGLYRLQVIGATPGSPGRHALFVDGAFSQIIQYTADLALNDTSRWKYRGSAEVLVSLPAGTHTLSVRASQNGTAVLPNSDITLDKFVLTRFDGTYEDYPASTFRLSGGSTLTWAANAAGFASVAGANQRADVYVTSMDTGYSDVTVDYRTAGASNVVVKLNGRNVATLTAGSAGLWRSQARLHLVEGINEIELSSASGASIESLSTVRVTAADGAEIAFEAEAGTRAGAAAVRTPAAGSNASGTVVGFVGNGAGNTLTFGRPAGIDAAGMYDLTVTYSNAELVGAHAYNPQVVDRRIDVTEVGGGAVGSAYFRYTYSWDSFWERTIPITLTTSGGGIRLGNATWFTPDIDRVTVAPVRIGSPTTVAITAP